MLSGGEVITESAAILLHLADSHPHSALAPSPSHPGRAQFLKWMFYVSSAIYALHWIKPDVRRIGASPDQKDVVINALHERIAFCWAHRDAQLNPPKFLLSDQITVLDLYVTVVSRFGPWRERFYQVAPTMANVVRRVDDDPKLKPFWDLRFPFEAG